MSDWPVLPRPLPLSRGTIQRATSETVDDAWLAERWADPRTRVLVVGGGDRPGVAAVEDNRLLLRSPAELPPETAGGLRLALGVDEDDVAYLAVVTEAEPTPGATLRQVGTLLDDRDVGLLTHAVGLAGWHATHPYCPRCGTLTTVRTGGHVRVCPADGSEHYPRTDPAVIVLVIDERDRALLGHQRVWPAGVFSTLAGFVETGESPEQAVVREIGEESGIAITDCHYAGSQPWPFPRSLMLGYYARARGVQPIPDGTEIETARWFSRDELAAELAAESIILPSGLSIARSLIEGWYGGPVGPDSGWFRPRASP